MTRRLQIASQILLVVGQTVNMIESTLSPRTKIYVVAGLACMQGIIGVIAHAYTPEGCKIGKEEDKECEVHTS